MFKNKIFEILNIFHDSKFQLKKITIFFTTVSIFLMLICGCEFFEFGRGSSSSTSTIAAELKSVDIFVSELKYDFLMETATVTIRWAVEGIYTAVNVEIINTKTGRLVYNGDISNKFTGTNISEFILGQNYDIYVAPKNGDAKGNYFYSNLTVRPPSVTNFDFMQAGDSITLTWKNPSAQEFYTREYNYVVVKDAVSKEIIKTIELDKALETTTLQAIEAGLIEGRTYQFGMYTKASEKGNNAESEIFWGDEFSYYTQSRLDEQTIFKVTATDGNSQIFNLKGYNIVKLSNIENSSVFLVRTNSSSTGTSAKSSRYVKRMYAEKSPTVSENVLKNYMEIENEVDSGPEIIREHFYDPIAAGEEVTVVYPGGGARSAISDSRAVKTPYVVGDKKTISCLMSAKSYTSTSLPATLRYTSDYCNVWAVDNYYTSGKAQGKQVNAEICQQIGKGFDDVCSYIRTIFGEEWEMLIKNGNFVSMEEESDTGLKVNIVIYDLYNDYYIGQSGGTFGLFFTGDYYMPGALVNNVYYSNGGKYLHVDSGFAVLQPKEILSTIVHEFQHLIHYGQKENYLPNSNSAVWYNEMLAMLCEDMMLQKLGLEERNGPQYRIATFNNSFSKGDYFSWQQNSLEHYARSYALGAWLCRKYDGADFVYDLMHLKNSSGAVLRDKDSLMYAVQERDPSATWETVLRDFGAELTTGKIFNRIIPSLEYSGTSYDYPMLAIDIFNYKTVGAAVAGPVYSTLSKNTETQIYQNGFDVSKILSTSKTKGLSDITLEFSGSSDSAIKEYIVVVKE